MQFVSGEPCAEPGTGEACLTPYGRSVDSRPSRSGTKSRVCLTLPPPPGIIAPRTRDPLSHPPYPRHSTPLNDSTPDFRELFARERVLVLRERHRQAIAKRW